MLPLCEHIALLVTPTFIDANAIFKVLIKLLDKTRVSNVFQRSQSLFNDTNRLGSCICCHCFVCFNRLNDRECNSSSRMNKRVFNQCVDLG